MRPVVVLLVEDDVLLRTVSMGTLDELGYRTIAAAEARQALALLDQHPEIEILMTDVKLPGMDGKQLAAEARRRRPKLKVLFVTGYSSKVMADVQLADAAVAVLPKPFQSDGLDHALRRLLAAKPQPQTRPREAAAPVASAIRRRIR